MPLCQSHNSIKHKCTCTNTKHALTHKTHTQKKAHVHTHRHTHVHIYRKHGKSHWAKLLHSSRFSKIPWKFSHEFKHLSLIILNNKHFWPRQCKSISTNTLMGLKPQTYSPVNLFLSTVHTQTQIHTYIQTSAETQTYKYTHIQTHTHTHTIATSWT